MDKELIDKIERINRERFSDKNRCSYVSVSKLKEYITEPFDKEGQAKACAEKGKDNPNYKYAGMNEQEIITLWDNTANESMRYGSLLDEFAEQLFTGNDRSMKIWKLDHNINSDSRLSANCQGLIEFWNDLSNMNFKFALREVPMYCESPAELAKSDLPFDSDEEVPSNLVGGRLDALFVNETNGKYLIVDWKTTDDISTQGYRGKKMKGPANKWDDCKMGEYTIQLHTYKNALAHTYEIAPEENIAVCVCNLLKTPDPNTGKYYRLYKENFPFDRKILDDVVDFVIYKRSLLNS